VDRSSSYAKAARATLIATTRNAEAITQDATSRLS
jgi:hypothetical protein